MWKFIPIKTLFAIDVHTGNMNSRSTLLDLKDIAFQSYSESPRVHLYIQIEYWSESQSTPHTSIARRAQLPVLGLRMLKRSRVVEKRSQNVVDSRVQSCHVQHFRNVQRYVSPIFDTSWSDVDWISPTKVGHCIQFSRSGRDLEIFRCRFHLYISCQSTYIAR